ncbi:polysaccharide lyase [Chitinophaga filiformis]|uniref:polysaccharide lyase n=1 Tax=Chitinophaga filiformis TaxID=104663 RepID=UPI001F4135B8|nr:polysaccharide lyase [Chitinophaga filiformis]MCF6406009.1 polysaccharide lyase [Chitinophaga filiformis]
MKSISPIVKIAVLVTVVLSCKKSLQNSELELRDQLASALTSPVPVIADWETGDASQWRGIITADPAQFYVGISSVVPVRQGTYAARFIVRPNDTIAGISGERCEADMSLEGKNNYTLETVGDEYYYGWSTYFPTTWTNPKNFGVFMQFHHNNYINPPISFNAHNDTIGVNIWTGHVTVNTSGKLNFMYKQYHILRNTLSKGLWNDFIVHVKFRPDWQGIVEVWHRLQGQAEFSKVLSVDSIPTMQWFDNDSLIIGSPVMHGSWYTSKIWLRNGFYRDKGGSNVNVIIHDNFARADNYSSIRARF